KEIDDLYQQSQIEKVCLKTQQYIDKYVVDDLEAGWFFQKMAKYQYSFSKIESQKKQTLAHRKNSYLLMPEVRIEFKKIGTSFNWNRSESIKKRIEESRTFDQLLIDLNLILGNLSFGGNSDYFEHALDSLGTLLGFETQRPDKQWKEGPDNLWLVGKNEFLLFECKNEVKEMRKAIYKSETGQINNSIAWFKKNYNQAILTSILIINTKHLDKGAGFNEPVRIMREGKMYKFKQNVKNFFLEFKEDDFENLSESKIQERLIYHNLTVDDLKNIFSEIPTS
ncbi:TPA: DEAD/DEAH box helicase, partial [Enterococcus faecalis]|nr:DEAD/DEAH box helicase [Enterococcus faecalis]